MPQNGWTTPEEKEFLKSLIPEYESCQVKKKYKIFWQRLYVDYFAKFPVVERLYPGVSQSDLTAEQKAICSNAILKQQKRLKEWYRWQMNPRSRNIGCTISKKDLHAIYNGRSRVLKPYEVFAKLFADQVEAVKKERCEKQDIKGRQQLAVWHEVSKELYQAATPEEIDAVKREMNNTSQPDGDESATSPEMYMRYLKKLPTILDATVSPAVRKAGVLAFVTIVGPCPEQNGKIVTQTLQFGDKSSTPVFSKTWADHDTIYAEELARFARRHEFPPDICAARSLSNSVPDPTSRGTDRDMPAMPSTEAEASSTLAQSPRASEPQKETPPADRSHVIQARVVGLNHVPNPDNSTNEKDPDSDEDAEDEDLEDDGLTMKLKDWSFSDDDWATFDSTLENMRRSTFQSPMRPSRRTPSVQSSSPSAPSSSPPAPSTSPSTSASTSTSRSTSASVSAPSVNPIDNRTSNAHPPKVPTWSASLFGHLLSEKSARVTSTTPPAFSLNSVRPPPALPPSSVEAPRSPSVVLPARPACSPSRIQRQLDGRGRQPRSTHQAPRSSPADSNLPFQLNAVQPSIFASLPAPTEDPSATPLPSSQLTSLTRPPSSLQLSLKPSHAHEASEQLASPIDDDERSPIPPPSISQIKKKVPSARTVKPSGNRKPKAQKTGPISQANAPPLAPPAQVPVIPSQQNQSGESGESNRRRSGRTSMPSRREEQLQSIGTNVTHVSRIVEKPSASDSAWFVAALESLRSCDLGDRWLNMVEKWATLEETMTEIKGGKGTLPVSGRPEEWQKWTSKTWHGMRAYHKPPLIVDAAEFGVAYAKWWVSMQPSFRHSEDGSLLRVYSHSNSNPTEDAWAHLRQPGQNGFVSIILLMAWWGDAISRTSRWDEDSLPAWECLVEDITSVLEELIRTCDPVPLDKPNKRPLPENEKTSTAPKRKKKRT